MVGIQQRTWGRTKVVLLKQIADGRALVGQSFVVSRRRSNPTQDESQDFDHVLSDFGFSVGFHRRKVLGRETFFRSPGGSTRRNALLRVARPDPRQQSRLSVNQAFGGHCDPNKLRRLCRDAPRTIAGRIVRVSESNLDSLLNRQLNRFRVSAIGLPVDEDKQSAITRETRFGLTDANETTPFCISGCPTTMEMDQPKTTRPFAPMSTQHFITFLGQRLA